MAKTLSEMSKPGNHSRAWEERDWDHLRNLLDQDVRIPYMAKKLGRTPGATAAAIHRLRHGLIKPSQPARQMGAKFTSYTKAQVAAMQRMDMLTKRERRKVQRRARTLFNVVLFGLKFTISKKERRHD